MRPGTVAIGYCHPWTVDAYFCASLANQLLHDGSEGRTRRVEQMISARSGPRVATARNEICRSFLDKSCEWLWMIDADMVFPMETLDRLLETANPDSVPILGGLCFIYQGYNEIQPTIYVHHDQEQVFVPVREYPRDALVKVNGTGAACMIIHRRVLVAMLEKFGDEPHPFFVESSYSERELGEDIAFCARAQMLGFPIHVHTGIKIGHVKPFILDETAFDRQDDPETQKARHLASLGLDAEQLELQGSR